MGCAVLPQPELRSRIKAAMALARIAGYRDLATRTDYEYATLKALGTSRSAGPRHLRDIAAACDLPYSWFTVPSIGEAIDDHARRLGQGLAGRGEPGPTAEEQRLAEDAGGLPGTGEPRP